LREYRLGVKEGALYEQGNKNDHSGTVFSLQHGTVSAVKRVKFVSDRISLLLRGHWCNIIVLNVPVPCEEKTDDSMEWYQCCRLKPATQIPLEPNHTETPTHIEPRTTRPMW